MQEVQTIPELIFKYLKNELTDPERKELMDWVNQSAENQLLFEKLTDKEMIRSAIREMMDVKESMWRKLVAQAPELREAEKPVRRIGWWKYAVAAAVALLVMITVGYLVFRSGNKEKETAGKIPATIPAQKAGNTVNGIMPAGYAAALTVANQPPIHLDATTKRQLFPEVGVAILVDQSHISYARQVADDFKKRITQTLHTLHTPRGGQYSITLPDGTTAWLNTASTLRFPSVFMDSVRRVYVKGEVLFNVAPVAASIGNRIPFLVTVLGENEQEEATIEVLGTHFNVNANNDRALLKATLLEGSVKISDITVKNDRNEKSLIMLPLQQAILDRKGNITVKKNVDTAAIVSWTKGRTGVFTFNDAPIDEVMGELGRWYNVDVSFTNNATHVHSISSILNRNTAIGDVIKTLNKLPGIPLRFRLEGRTIIVSNT